VGNELGAGSAAGARRAMGVAAIVAPALWAAEACVLGAPAAQRALVSLFAAPGDVALLAQLRQLLEVVLAMLLFDGLQTVLQGVVQARAQAPTCAQRAWRRCVAAGPCADNSSG
jgi:Na+-driven multidrug efflux pump